MIKSWTLSAHLFQNVHFLVLFVFSQKHRPLSAFAKSLMELICQTHEDLRMPRSIKPFFDTFRSHLTLYPSIVIHFALAVNVFWKCTYIMQITTQDWSHCMILTFSPQFNTLYSQSGSMTDFYSRHNRLQQNRHIETILNNNKSRI